jgi:hypothetical protein
MLNGKIGHSQSHLYDVEEIQKIEIFFNYSNWDYQLDTAKIGSDTYLLADWVKINDILFDSVGVKYKGNSSYDSSYQKNPVHIALDEFKSQSYQGFGDIKLSNGHSDPSMIREVLAYKILSSYMDCPASNFAQVYINGSYIGLYTNVENIDKEYCSDIFYTSEGVFIKANPLSPGPYSRSNLKYISDDSSDYFNLYEMKSEFGWNELTTLCNLVSSNPSNIDSAFDIDKVIWMLAFNNVLVNLDSYSGAFAQNYYLYKDNHQQYNPLVWDLNMSFGAFPYAGMQGGGMGSLGVPDMQNLPVSLHFSDSDWPLIKNTMSNSQLKKIYHAHVRTITNEFFTNQSYLPIAQQLQSIIDTAVQSDENKFFTHEQFLGGLTTNVQFGSYTVPGISVLMNSRTDYLLNSAEFSYSLPSITAVLPENTFPEIHSEVFITAQIENADYNSVFLSYRFASTENFIKILMHDDGMHHDGEASDHTYGASFNMDSDWADYYIYAENGQAGMFSPERAEYEYYSIMADVVSSVPGEIVINEFLAVNQNDTIDEEGQHEDWIELYNTTDQQVDLFGLFLTDDFTNPMKFAFPENTFIQPHDYLTLWADEDSTTSSFLHCNFKLSGNGEEIMLSDIEGNIFDTIVFGPQLTDISVGRCPDGSGEMTILPNTSFNFPNCESGIEQNLINKGFASVYPNPGNNAIHIAFPPSQSMDKFMIINILGEKYYESGCIRDTLLDTSLWPAGIYLIVSANFNAIKLLVNH